MYFMHIYFHLLWSENKFTDFFVLSNFLFTLHTTLTIKESKFWEYPKSQDGKTQFESKRRNSDYWQQSFVLKLYKVTLEILRNSECFEFTSIYGNEISELVSITLVGIASVSCVRFASGNYLLKPYKWDRENAIIAFWSHVRIMLGSVLDEGYWN